MSYDFDTLPTPCDHMVRRERMVFDTDGRTLLYKYDTGFYMRGVVNGEDSLKVFVSGVEVPRNHPQWGWDLVIDPYTRDAPFTDKRKRIVFRHKQRLTDIIIEIDYRTIPAHCWKCQGSGRVYDYKPSTTNSFVHITDTGKLVSRATKFLLTSKCEFYPSFTCPIKDWIGVKIADTLVEEDIAMAISSSLGNLKQIQMLQKGFQTLTPSEVFRGLEHVGVQQSPDDPSKVVVKVSVLSYGSGDPTPLTLSMRTNPQ